MIQLTMQHVIQMHDLLIAETGGSEGLRDENLLASALAAPFQTFDNLYAYPSMESKAACLAFGLISNHPFVDGNKRIGILSMLTFLELNGIYLNYTDDELIKLGLGIADHSILLEDVNDWILSHN